MSFMPKMDTTAHIVTEVGRLLDLQAELMQHTFRELTEDQLDDYAKRRDRIRQLCSELTGLHR